MNLITQKEEKLEGLPKFEKSTEAVDWDYYKSNLPYKRIRNWIKSNVGKHIDGVSHRFANAKWLPTEYRNLKTLWRYVEKDTFIQNGEVYYCADTPNMRLHPHGARRIINDWLSIFYVHPETKILCFFQPPRRKNIVTVWKSELAERLKVLGPYHQLYKEDGIWYEVKAEILKIESPIIPYYVLKKKPDEPLLEESNKNYLDSKSNHVKIILKRQLNSKELRKHSLNNN